MLLTKKELEVLYKDHDESTIIFDNAGGAYLLIDGIYQHHYQTMSDLYRDFAEYLKSGNCDGWEGNELCLCGDNDQDDFGICKNCDGQQQVVVEIEDEKNGCYRECCTIQSIIDIAGSFGNAGDFCKSAGIEYLE